ncbi:MAG: twin-arginine translocation signal domain-containing protein [Candidatus Latescibacteria bacterium]|nr:twin-arginine translocation signal domain-containing protein [Candidatus Latescibacterota bacterium]
MSKISRRNILKTGAMLTAGAAGFTPGVRVADAADRAGSKYNWGHTMDFGEQYYVRISEILGKIRSNEIDRIGDISSRMAETIKKDGSVWYHAHEGHMCYIEFAMENKGNPGIIKSHTRKMGDDYALMKSGDVLVTNFVNEDVRKARDNGVHVVGVPVNYIDNEWSPRGFVQANVNDWLLGDVSTEILQSYIPYHQGIVDCPEIPEMKLCPSSANSLSSLFWMFQCEVANKIKDKKAKAVDKSAVFLDTVLDRLDNAYRLQKNYMFDHAPTVAKKIGNGGHYHVTTDHSGVQSESNGVAMGPMMTNAFRGDMKKGDVHLLATIESDSQKIIDEAKKAQETGMFVVSIAPGNSFQIRRYSDVFIDNLCPEGGGLMEIKGFDQKVGTVGGIMNNMLMWIFTAQFLDEMVRRGWVPWFWLGFYQVGGREYDNAVKPFFQKQGF